MLFDGNESKYELWKVKFLGYDARDNGRKALEILRQHYQGKGKPRVIALYTELTSLKKRENESVVDYMLRAEKSATGQLRDAEEVISDAILIAMVLKGLPSEYNTFATVIVQREKQMTFAEFKSALRSHEESTKALDTKTANANENVMFAKQRIGGNCFKCGRKGHKSSECLSKTEKWCSNCRNKSYDTKNCRKKKDAAKTAAEKTAPRDTKQHENKEHTFAFVSSETKNNSGIYSKHNLILLVDTGATSHIINDKSKFVDFDKDFNTNAHDIELADGSKANVVLGKGNAKVKLYDVNGNARDVMLNSALYVPSYQQSIFSVHAAVEGGGG